MKNTVLGVAAAFVLFGGGYFAGRASLPPAVTPVTVPTMPSAEAKDQRVDPWMADRSHRDFDVYFRLDGLRHRLGDEANFWNEGK